MPSIQVRALQNGDPGRGQSLANFIYDIEAVAQIIGTTLKLLQGEWWESLNTGTPVFQSILGVPNTTDGVGLILRQRILSVPFVIGVQNLVVTYGPSTRHYTFSCSVITAFGTIGVSGTPGNQAVINQQSSALAVSPARARRR
jgi:hypothetical protein